MTHFKPIYTEEEVEELIEWLNAHRDRFPKRLKISENTVSNNLTETVDALIYNARKNHKNVVFCGLIGKLEDIREALMKELNESK